MVRRGIRVSFAARERHAVVGGDDDQGVFEKVAALECVEHLAEVCGEVFGFGCVMSVSLLPPLAIPEPYS